MDSVAKGESASVYSGRMKFGSVLYALSISAALVFQSSAQSGSPEDLYLEAYRLIQDGDSLTQTGQSELARQRYTEAEANLKKVQSLHPSYSKNAVEFRLDYVQERLKGLPPAREGAVKPPTKLPLTNPNDPKALQERIAQLESANAALEAKLREALSAHPAAVDPSEFGRMQERVHQLEKEKELLRVRVEQAQAKQPQAAEMAMLDQVRGELEATKKQVRDNVATVATLSQENQRLQALAQSGQGAEDANARRLPKPPPRLLWAQPFRRNRPKQVARRCRGPLAA